MALKVMVVDDSSPDRVNLQNVLMEAGHIVIACSSGAEAIKTAVIEIPDLIFMDVVMDKMDGYQACRRLKTTAETQDIPIVMVTSSNEKIGRMWATQQGASAYVTKPYTPEQIQAQVELLCVSA